MINANQFEIKLFNSQLRVNYSLLNRITGSIRYYFHNTERVDLLKYLLENS